MTYMLRSWPRWLLPLGLLAVLAYVAGCGSGSSSGPTGTLQVGLTDAGTEGIQSVFLAITKVVAVPAGSEEDSTGSLPVIATFDPPMVVDVMQYQYQQVSLGSAAVTAGPYSQLRLVLAPNVEGQDPVNYLVFSDSPEVKVPLKSPSGQQTGLKIPGYFTVTAGETNTVTVDFDPARAIETAGPQYLIKPTGIRLTEQSQLLPDYGALVFTLAPAEAWPLARVSIVDQATSTVVAGGTVSGLDGTFRAGLPAGSYSIQITADGYLPYDSALLDPPVTYDVVTGADTDAGTITLTRGS